MEENELRELDLEVWVLIPGEVTETDIRRTHIVAIGETKNGVSCLEYLSFVTLYSFKDALDGNTRCYLPTAAGQWAV